MTRARLAALLLVVCVGALVIDVRRVTAQRVPTAPPPILVTAVFTPATASIGDRVTLTVRLIHPDDVVVNLTPPNIDQVDVLSALPGTISPGDQGMRTTTFAYTMQPFVLGTLDTGILHLSWLAGDGSTDLLEAPGAKLVVAPVRAEDDKTLRPLKPQAIIAGAPPAWAWPVAVAGALMVIAAVSGLLALFIIGRRRRRVVVAPNIDMSPERVAREALDALNPSSAARMISPSSGRVDYPSYYGTLALTVRTYLAARFGFNAHALTTSELEHRMVSHGVDRWQARLVGGLLERCDAAVYARRFPDPASADHDLTVAYEIVELSRPHEVAHGEAVLA